MYKKNRSIKLVTVLVWTWLHLLPATFVTAAGSLPVQPTDSATARLTRQLAIFPHEKLHVQTDKPNYLSGERTWFRVHLVDALDHSPLFMSRYVYAELFSPFGDLVERIKIRPDTLGVYAGHLDLAEDLPEGNYTLRAYTRYSRNRGNEAFFRKSIGVHDPYSLQVETLPGFSFLEDGQVKASFRFVDRAGGEEIIPEVVTLQLAGGRVLSLEPENGEFTASFSLPAGKPRAFLLGLIHESRKYNRYYTIPYPPGEFDVTFHPEGGWLVPGRFCRVGFKCITPSGLGEDVSGVVYNSGGEEVARFSSLKHGMGYFDFLPVEGERYHALCSAGEGDPRRFELPVAKPDAMALIGRFSRGRFVVEVARGESERDSGTLSLLVHQGGVVGYHEPVPAGGLIAFPGDFLPSGISSLLLLDEEYNIVSERLVFHVKEDDFPVARYNGPDRPYKRRELVSLSLKLDCDSLLAGSNVALRVTDGSAVPPDTENSLVSTLLLSSELEGHVEAPAGYFRGGEVDTRGLDALMLTQGWRRYDIPAVLKGDISVPSYLPEQYQEINGRSEARVFRSMRGGQISLYAMLDTLTSMETTTADKEGRFQFMVEYPEGTEITVQSLDKGEGQSNFIHLDSITYPTAMHAALPASRLQGGGGKPAGETALTAGEVDRYLMQANEEYSRKHGIRTVMLEELTVTARRAKQQPMISSYYSPLSSAPPMSQEEIERRNFSDMTQMLLATPGITLRGGIVTTNRSELPVLLVLNDVPSPAEQVTVETFEVSEIEEMFVIPEHTSIFGYYPNTSGALVVTTKGSSLKNNRTRSINIDRIKPLGYQQPAEFYSPKYETATLVDSPEPDFRTTIYWNPGVHFSPEGEAVVEFYTADTPTTYRVEGEGVTRGGKLIRLSEEIDVESSIK